MVIANNAGKSQPEKFIFLHFNRYVTIDYAKLRDKKEICFANQLNYLLIWVKRYLEGAIPYFS